MNKKDKVKFIKNKLNELYPNPPIPLDHKDPYTLLIAVLLSAQTTDLMVNRVTPSLFALANNPYKMAKLDPDDVKDSIKFCGLAPTKAKNIVALSKIIVNKHDGIVPNNFADLEFLPGVGHKTASVVMSQAFNVPAFPVDTHIHRLAWRWGLSTGKNVEQTEKDLKNLYHEKDWNKLHLQIIFFGREYCKARNHNRESCPICSIVGRKVGFK